MKPRQFAAVLIALAAASGCHHKKPDMVITDTERTVHGVVSVTGTSNDQRLMLASASGPLRLHASVIDSAALARSAGTELSVRGADERGALRVRSFTVITAHGRPVVDGYLHEANCRLVLDTPKARLEIRNPPDALRRMVGARVWIQGPLDTGPVTYGVIEPKP